MNRKIFDTFLFIIILGLLGVVYQYRVQLSSYIVKYYATYNNETIGNTYTKNINYLGFQETTNFVPSNKQELINVIYTVLDNGWDTFSFYCDKSYSNYEDDLKNITDDGTLATINNYVHPYNSYKTLNISMNNFVFITISIDKNYSSNEIQEINAKVNSIMNEIITKSMTNEEKIKAFHDYIVNNTVYDSDEAYLVEIGKTSNLSSYKANSVLINGIGLCGGYAGRMAIFLSKLGINNFKVSTDKHVWNVLLTSEGWKHIDTTWDDTVMSDGSNSIIYDYYMITTTRLKQLDASKHNFDPNFYPELK